MTDAAPYPALARLNALVRRAAAQQAAVAEAETRLAAAKAALLHTQRVELPELMKECGQIARLDVEGVCAEAKDDLNISIINADAAHAWLREHGHDALLRTELRVTFPPGADAAAQALQQRLRGDNQHAADTTVTTRVHPATLRAWAKEQHAAGVQLPEELFRVTPFQWVKLTITNAISSTIGSTAQ